MDEPADTNIPDMPNPMGQSDRAQDPMLDFKDCLTLAPAQLCRILVPCQHPAVSLLLLTPPTDQALDL